MLEGTKRKKSHRKRKRRGLHGTGTTSLSKIRSKDLVDDGKKVLFTVGGLVAGNIIHNSIANLVTKNGSEPAEGFKKFLAPIATAGVGFLGTRMLSGDMKFLGYGAMGAAVIKGVKTLSGKDLLSGSDSIQGLMGEEMLPGIGSSELDEMEKAVRAIESGQQVQGNEEDDLDGPEQDIEEISGADDDPELY